jgi:hypothetical protein
LIRVLLHRLGLDRPSTRHKLRILAIGLERLVAVGSRGPRAKSTRLIVWDRSVECRKSLPKRRGGGGSDLDDHSFAMKIASALKPELKDQNSRAKLVAGWTGANERMVKNWILGRYAPCGRHLVVLAHHSDQVLNAILLMADRLDRLLGEKVEDLRRKVLELAAIIGQPDLDE